MTAPLELFLIHGSPYAWRVQLTLEHKGLPYETRVLSMSAGDLKQPEFRAMSPRGKVPVLRAGDLVVTESIAILAYLDRAYPDRPVFGTTAEEAAIIWRLVSEYTSYVDEAVEAFTLPLYFGRAEAEADRIRRAVETLARELTTYDGLLTSSPFLAGAAPTAADFVVFPHVQSILRAAGKPAAKAFDLPFLPLDDALPAVAAWLSRIEALPGYERTYPPHWR